MQKLGLLKLLRIHESYPTERENVASWGLSKGKQVDIAKGIANMEEAFIMGHEQRGKEYKPELYAAAFARENMILSYFTVSGEYNKF